MTGHGRGRPRRRCRVGSHRAQGQGARVLPSSSWSGSWTAVSPREPGATRWVCPTELSTKSCLRVTLVCRRSGGSSTRDDPRPRRAVPEPRRRLRRQRRASRLSVRARRPRLPAAGSTVGLAIRRNRQSPLERLASFEPKATPAEPGRGAVEGPLTLSFYQVDDYSPARSSTSTSTFCECPIAPHSLDRVWLRAAPGRCRNSTARQAKGYVMSEEDLDAAFERAWSNQGFLTREHEEAAPGGGRAALRRFRQGADAPGAVVPAYVEREFSFLLDGDRIRGRMDRVDIERLLPGEDASDGAARGGEGERQHADVASPALPGLHPERVTITDYKSSDVRDPPRQRSERETLFSCRYTRWAFQAETAGCQTRCSSGSSSRGWWGAWRWMRSGSTRPGPRSAGRQPASGPSTSKPPLSTSPAATARSVTSAHRARRNDRSEGAAARTGSGRSRSIDRGHHARLRQHAGAVSQRLDERRALGDGGAGRGALAVRRRRVRSGLG